MVLDRAALRSAHTSALSGFTYVADGARDQWRSHAKEALSGTRWRGDCDDLASTVLDILGIHGADPRCLWRALVSSERNGRVDHMVGLVQTFDGNLWVVGDTFGPPRRLEDMPHELIKTSRVDERDDKGRPVWRAAKITRRPV